MKVAIVGGGRIGLPLTRRFAGVGNEVTLFTRFSKPDVSWSEKVTHHNVSRISKAGGIDMLVLATPASALADGFPAEDVPASTVIVSVMAGVDLPVLREHFGNRRLARFMCTSAVQHGDATVFVDASSDDVAIQRLRQLLEVRLIPVEKDRFDIHTRIIVAAPMLCGALAMITDHISEEPIREDERIHLIHMLSEAERMIWSNGGDPTSAFESAITPGGITDMTYREVFRRPPRK